MVHARLLGLQQQVADAELSVHDGEALRDLHLAIINSCVSVMRGSDVAAATECDPSVAVNRRGENGSVSSASLTAAITAGWR